MNPRRPFECKVRGIGTLPICSPSIVGPLSELSTRVHVRGIAATVEVTALGPPQRVVANGTLGSPDDRIDLLSNERLTTADRLVARQSLGGEQSPDSPSEPATGVQAGPASASDLARVGFDAHLYNCRMPASVSGAIPGATIDVSFNNNVQPSGKAEDGRARFDLQLPRSSQAPAAARQVAPHLPPGPGTIQTPELLPVPDGQPPPTLTLNSPLKACQGSVPITDVFDGAKVTVTRSSGDIEFNNFEFPALWLGLNKPLIESEIVTARQEFLSCKPAPGDLDGCGGGAEPGGAAGPGAEGGHGMLGQRFVQGTGGPA